MVKNDGSRKTGWWLTYPSEKYEFVNGKDDITCIMEKSLKPPTSLHLKMCFVFFSKLFLTTLNSMLLEEDFGKLLLLLLAHELRLLLFKLGNLGMTSVLGIPILHKDSH
jgi:hypothetical protein